MLKFLLFYNLFSLERFGRTKQKLNLAQNILVFLLPFSCETENIHLIPPSWYQRVGNTRSSFSSWENVKLCNLGSFWICTVKLCCFCSNFFFGFSPYYCVKSTKSWSWFNVMKHKNTWAKNHMLDIFTVQKIGTLQTKFTLLDKSFLLREGMHLLLPCVYSDSPDLYKNMSNVMWIQVTGKLFKIERQG